MMGNQGSPNPSFFYFDDFASLVVMACSLRSLRRPTVFFLRVIWCARSARARSAHKDLAQEDGAASEAKQAMTTNEVKSS